MKYFKLGEDGIIYFEQMNTEAMYTFSAEADSCFRFGVLVG